MVLYLRIAFPYVQHILYTMSLLFYINGIMLTPQRYDKAITIGGGGVENCQQIFPPVEIYITGQTEITNATIRIYTSVSKDRFRLT